MQGLLENFDPGVKSATKLIAKQRLMTMTNTVTSQGIHSAKRYLVPGFSVHELWKGS